MQTQEIELKILVPYDKNQKKHPKSQIDKIVKSIKEFGFTQPLVVDSSNIVIIGHGRLAAAKRLRMQTVPCIVRDDLSEAQVKALRIADNKLNESEWDDEALKFEFAQLLDLEYDVEMTGFDLAEIEAYNFEEDEQAEVQDDDFEVPEEIETDIKPGDLIQIGEHKLLCGDSTDPKDVIKLMKDERADLAHNDPPYGMKKENEGVLNDNLNTEKLLAFNKKWIPLQFKYLKQNGSWYCWGIDQPLMDIYYVILRPQVLKEKISFRNLITWNKGAGMGQLSETHRCFATADEKCLFIMMGKQDLVQNKDQFPEEWRPLLTYFQEQRKIMGWSTKDVVEITGKTSASHYFTESQFMIPTAEHYKKIQAAAGKKAFTKPFAELEKGANKFIDEFRKSRAYFDNVHDNMNNVWNFKRTSQQEREHTGGHATPKPLELCGRAIKSSCPPGGLVLDFFLGSGSTMVAAHQLERKCYGIELDPKYCQVIVDRMRAFHPGIKVKKNGRVWKEA